MKYESAEKESSRSLVSLQGLDGKHLVFFRRGEAFVLTSSFIERDYRQLGIGVSHMTISGLHETWGEVAETKLKGWDVHDSVSEGLPIQNPREFSVLLHF